MSARANSSDSCGSAAWFFQNARDLYGVVSAEGVFLEVNPAWTQVTGWSAEELLGRNLVAFLHEDSIEPVREMGRRILKDGDVPSRMRLRCKDGRWIWLEGYVRLGPDGQMMGMQRDVTAEHQHAEALRRAEQVQTLLSETAGVGLWSYDPRTDRLSWSAEWTRMLADAGLRMGTSGEFAEVCHPDDLPLVLAAMGATVEQGRPASFEHRIRRPEGGWMSIRVHIRGEKVTEGLHVVHGLSQDVSEAGQARADLEAHNDRLRLALAAARACVVEIDYDRRAAWTSPEFVDRIGYAMSFQQAARPVWPCLAAADVEAVEAAVRGWLGGAPAEPLEARIVTRDGERWMRIFTEIQRDAAGRLRRTISLMLDVDDQKRQELALREAKQAALAATEAKSQFLANMSHELRTPMNGVLGVLHLLKDMRLPSEARPLVAEALGCGGMLQALLDDIVDFSRVEAGRLELAEDAVDPRAVAESVAAMLRPLAADKGVALSLELGDLPAWVVADPLRLRQCLFNLGGNAVKFTEEGAVAMRASVTPGPRPRLRFEIEDTGVGIPEALQPRLFERFQQGDASTTRRFGGSGLGLAITRKLAVLMGGEVGFRSVPGQGSTFWLDLPLRLAGPPVAEAAPNSRALDGLRVLVVEDNATNRMIARKMLESLGAGVATADDGEEGLAAATVGAFDLILMDVQMPKMDGVEATRQIRSAEGPAARTPIIGLTANVMADQCAAYAAVGMDGVVAKPVSPAALLREIQRIADCEPGGEPDQVATLADAGS